MCGRYAQTGKARRKALTFAEEIQHQRDFDTEVRKSSWNVAPTTLSLAVRADDTGGLSAAWLSWGLDAGATAKPINARIESASSKFTFRDAWKTRRCLVPVDGWYEWREEQGRKQPYYFQRRDREPLWFAGLWSGPTYCLLTTAADGPLAAIHHRRPLTVQDTHARSWITVPPASIETTLEHTVHPHDIEYHPVSPQVSNARHDGPDLIAPLPPPAQKLLFELS